LNIHSLRPVPLTGIAELELELEPVLLAESGFAFEPALTVPPAKGWSHRKLASSAYGNPEVLRNLTYLPLGSPYVAATAATFG
jgi:hypothetical protein